MLFFMLRQYCEACGAHTHPFYKIDESSTYEKIKCSDAWCGPYSCVFDDDVCTFKVSYGEGSAVTGKQLYLFFSIYHE